MSSDYEQRKADRIARYRERAERAQAESEAAQKAAGRIMDNIPMGQPVLVGHHSEKRHRADLNRVDNAFRRMSEAEKKARYWRGRAITAETSDAISSDDPNAVERLTEKAEEIEREVERMKAVNKLLRKRDAAGLAALGMPEATIARMLNPEAGDEPGFPPFMLANRRANIRRIRERIATLQASAGRESTEAEIDGVRIVENADENRVQLFFPGKPSDDARTLLKSRGFRWSPSNGCWQRQLTQAAVDVARLIVERLSAQNASSDSAR